MGRWGDGAKMVKLVQDSMGAKLGVGTMLSRHDGDILDQFKDPRSSLPLPIAWRLPP